MSIVNVTDFISQIAGFATGGVLVAFLGGPHMALAVDCVTYVVSAVMVRLGTRPASASIAVCGVLGATRAVAISLACGLLDGHAQ